MDALDIKISQIKNLNLVYLYHIDEILKNLDNKYLGLKVVYDNNIQELSLDFKDKHFNSFLKQVVKRYKQEFPSRPIILLGDLTEAFFNDKNVFIPESKQNQKIHEPRTEEQIRIFLPYLKEILKLIITHIRGFENIRIDSITGFNKKYQVTYSFDDMKKSFSLILYTIDAKTLFFKIGELTGKNLNINGSITNKIDEITSTFSSPDSKYSGSLIYNLNTRECERKIIEGNHVIYHSNQSDVITEEDIELIKFYLNLFAIDLVGEVLKTSDDNFMISNKEILASNEDTNVLRTASLQLIIESDEVIINYHVSNVLNKKKYLIDLPLDTNEYYITLKKVHINSEDYILVQKREKTNLGESLNFQLYTVDTFDFYHPFDITEEYTFPFNVKNMNDLKRELSKMKVILPEGGK